MTAEAFRRSAWRRFNPALTLTPVTLTEAHAFVRAHHRHHRAAQGGLFALAISARDAIVAVAVIGRPVARMLADDFTAELTRLASDGTRHSCSKLYGAAWKAARALGYRKLITYTLAEEGGGFGPRGRLALPRRGRRRKLVSQGEASRRHAPAPDQDPVGGGLVTAPRLLTCPRCAFACRTWDRFAAHAIDHERKDTRALHIEAQRALQLDQRRRDRRIFSDLLALLKPETGGAS